MKIANKVIALVMALLMIVGTCAVAASAASSAQAAIDAAAAGSVVTLANKLYEETVVINKNLTVDLAGGTIRGVDGKNGIVVENGAKVTIKNGEVSSYFANVDSQTMIETVEDKSPSAIVVKSGDVTLEGVRVIGGFTRIPTTKEYLPTGVAVELLGASNVTLKNSTLIGRYGVKNDKAVAGGKVIIEDAVIFGVLDAIKDWSKETLTGNCKRVNATDHMTSALEDIREISEKEKKMVDLLFDDRLIIYTQAMDEENIAEITVEGDTATVVATVDATGECVGADCSYLQVPSKLVLADKKTKVDLVAAGDGTYTAEVDAADVDENCTVEYLTSFVMSDLVADYVVNAAAKLTAFVDKAVSYKDEEYKDLINDFYFPGIRTIKEAWDSIDELGNEVLLGLFVKDIPEYDEIVKAILAVGGRTMYTLDGTRNYLTVNQCNYFGLPTTLANDPAAVVGTLDRIDNLRKEFEAKFPTVEDMDQWDEMAAWLCDQVPVVLDIIDEAHDNFEALLALLEKDNIKDILELGDFGSVTADLKTYDKYLENVIDMTKGGKGKEIVDLIEDNKADIAYYVKDAVAAYRKLDTYYKPADFVDGNLLQVFKEVGGVNITVIEQGTFVEVEVKGAGKVAYEGDTTGSTDSGETVYFDGEFTLTAMPDLNNNFLYYVNTETGRIFSTEATITVNTTMNRYLTAVFCGDTEEIATFTYPTGLIVAEVPAWDGMVYDVSDIALPAIPGATSVEWPCTGGNTIDLLEATNDYSSGMSAFVSNADGYDGAGHILQTNYTTPYCFVITPKYESANTFTVKVQDGAATGTASIKYAYTATFTAKGSNFSYWVDVDTGMIVSVKKTYTMTVVRDTSVKAVYGVQAPVAVTNITAVDGTKPGKVTFYAERSSNASIASHGILVSTVKADVEDPANASANLQRGVSANTKDQGIYLFQVNEGSLYARSFIELDDGRMIYSGIVKV